MKIDLRLVSVSPTPFQHDLLRLMENGIEDLARDSTACCLLLGMLRNVELPSRHYAFHRVLQYATASLVVSSRVELPLRM